MFQLLLSIIYLAFISLGLPDSLLGAAWPSMYQDFHVPVSFAGIISIIIALGTVISSLACDHITRKLGTGKLTVISVFLTTAAIFGFSISHSLFELCLWAIPYGLGAGSVDAALNNYVAVHYASRHMSWLHCMWGIGASAGPYIMGYSLENGLSWKMGYRYISLIQLTLTVILVFSLPLWKQNQVSKEPSRPDLSPPLSLRNVIHLPAAKDALLAFFCYCAFEQTANLWSCSYLVIHKEISAHTAAIFASLFFVGITIGRGIHGFLTIHFKDVFLIRLGIGIMFAGCVLLCLPLGKTAALSGLITIGIGSAPIYPSMLHATPRRFGKACSQAVIGIQMAAAYTGTCLMPAFFGILADDSHVFLLPFYLIFFLVLLTIAHERLIQKTSK